MDNLRYLIGIMPNQHKNIRTISALEKLIANLDNIPVEEIENLLKKHGI